MTTTTKDTLNQIVFVPLGQTHNNRYQAGEIDQAKVDEIKQSLRENRDNGTKGLLQVPIARLDGDGLNYELAFARHRREAFQQLAYEDQFWAEIPLIVRPMTDLQMFEALAIENLKRRDINPMEKSEIYRTYMETFGKTSREAADFFHTSEEDIRGTIRFGNLVPTAQELLRNDELNVTEARVVLSAQKVLSRDWLDQALEDVKNHTWESPQIAIHNALETDANVVRFASDADAWQDLKKFPVKYLPPLQRKQIAQILDVQKDDLARKEHLSQIMQRIESGMEFADNEFQMFSPAQLERVRILANPPTCTSCPLNVSFNGSHFCGLKLCYERKTVAWQQAEMVRHAKELGIPLYVNVQTDGQAIELDRWDHDDVKLFTDRDPDLRLKPTTRTIWNNFTGVPKNLIVVITGKAAEKRLKKQERESVQAQLDTRKESEELVAKLEREREIRAIKVEFLVRFHWEVASAMFSSALEGVTNLNLLLQLLDMMEYSRVAQLPDGVDDEDELVAQALDMKKADGLRQMRRIIMHHALYQQEEVRTIETKKPIIEFAKACQNIAGKWGVKLGRTWMSEAEKYQADLDAAIKGLGKPKKEKVPA